MYHDTTKTRLKILISAYSVAPHRGSEPAVGWNTIKEVSKYHDLWVITRSDRAELIEPEIQKNPLPNVHWIYYDMPYWMRFWRVHTRGQDIHYLMWQRAISSLGKKWQEKINFDLAHHVTYVKYWAPSYLALLPLPFLWGPVGGGEIMPVSFYKTLTPLGKLYEYNRSIARKIGQSTPAVRSTAKRTTYGLATTQETAEKMRQIGTPNVSVQQAIGMSKDEIEQLAQIPIRDAKNIRFLSIGRLLEWKGFHLGIEAFASIHEDYPDSEYWIIGDGPQRKHLENLAERYGVASKVRFWGKIPREQVLQNFADCDVLVHPSLHESGGGVCLEAMGAGRPVICLDLGGPAEIVSDSTGIKVPAKTPEQAKSDIANAMRCFGDDRELRQIMGNAGREHVKNNYSWTQIGERFANLYRQIVSEYIHV